ncbi:dihydroxyacetone kinase subunit L [Pseudoflavonifractor sp. 524-17]|uniref:dihydroxyacetone kinase subunit DhaL n=1 Tax=Pseudoflavonifractor sp. 524-17 TaxID=2304577 RepID=UPI0013799B3B|nr:dihydroxyacetone kinase subunit DhaL [Pseudoflavonifractor sp. 524-17]NCE63781.1 dihydroxyacetone kinase subunit L [Pseudoflavonifractor sp. 524-17]
MAFSMTSAEYVDYLVLAGREIEQNGDYVTALDAKTGDGDHWVNLNMGFQKLISMEGELRALPLAEMLKKVGMTLMSAIGGSSGVLYGSSYIAAAKALKDRDTLDIQGVRLLLETQLQAIMDRGKAQPGWKTMIDSLYEGVQALSAALDAGADDRAAVEALKQGANQGMEHTREMEAVKGRASYQSNKGVGELDPGAVTMCMQLQCLGDYILSHKL